MKLIGSTTGSIVVERGVLCHGWNENLRDG
uniref:Uncharacterized protein n=1 Tax=Anguilla anguilla TaxID=7936 RepID=A0A0E9T3Q2_ANGAN